VTSKTGKVNIKLQQHALKFLELWQFKMEIIHSKLFKVSSNYFQQVWERKFEPVNKTFSVSLSVITLEMYYIF